MTEPELKRSRKAGLPPGTAVHIGERRAEAMVITRYSYGAQSFDEHPQVTVDQCAFPVGLERTTWVSIQGLHQVDELQRLATGYGLHPLVVEDIVNTHQRPKVEDYGDYLFIVLKALYPEGDNYEELVAEQVSLVLGKNFVLSFQEGPQDAFVHVRERLRNGKGRLRSSGSDYLAYTLIDAVVDHYFPILERVGEDIEQLEDRLVADPGPDTLPTLHRLKRAMIVLRRSVWPVRELVAHLERGESSLVKQSTLVYLRDVYDHTIQVIEATETLRDMLAGMLDIYLSSLSNRLNETMKVLAIIATLFIPLTFLAGVYGMNFKYMPELSWPWGYPAVLGIMAVVAGCMLWFFRRKKWL